MNIKKRAHKLATKRTIQLINQQKHSNPTKTITITINPRILEQVTKKLNKTTKHTITLINNNTYQITW